jgi:hypothetical protein
VSKARLILGGIKSLLPGRPSYRMPSSRIDARYGYAVWMRHLCALAAHGFAGPFREVVELGPGDSVATGISAVLSGAHHYVGLDVIDHVARAEAPRQLAELEAMFEQRASVPGPEEFPHLYPALDDRARHSPAVTADPSTSTLHALAADVAAIARGEPGGGALRYLVPWRFDSIAAGTADLVLSQAVLQEIPHGRRHSALRDTLQATAAWLRPGAVASHQIDLGMYDAEPWNVHWSWSDATWALVRGRRENYVNREPLSTYVRTAEAVGLEVVAVDTVESEGVADAALAPRYAALPAYERRTRAAHLILRRS